MVWLDISLQVLPIIIKFLVLQENCNSLKNFFPNASKFFQIDFLSEAFIIDINSMSDVIINCIGITTRRINIQNQNTIEFINSKLQKYYQNIVRIMI